MNYPLKSIQSGVMDYGSHWVTIGFSSEGRDSDVLHIVAYEEDDKRYIEQGLLPIYLERFNQKLRCYRGADQIHVGHDSVTVTLNKVGQDSLGLPETLHFAPSLPIDGFADAREIFRKMQAYECGKIIQVA